MSISHSTEIRDQIASLIASKIDAASSSGKLIIQNASGGTLATLPLPVPSFLTPSGGVITANTITPRIVSTTGTAALFVVKDGDLNEIFRGNVGITGSGADCILNNLDLIAGGRVTISSCTYTAPV